jgi:glycosyltransferase involved in cell wall biosynthesis
MHDVYHIKEHPSRLKMLRVIASLGTQLVTVSDQMRRFYSGLAGGKTFFELVHNGVDNSAFGQPAKRRNEKFTFVSVGRLVSLKGFDVLLEALARTGPGGPDLRILGEGKDLPELEARARLLGIEDRVEFLGFRDDVAEVLSNADAFVLASRSEGLSCSVVEAMAAGLPCVVTAVGGNSELVADGETGFLVPSEDPTALAVKLTQLSSDRELSRALGAGGRKRVAEYFSLEATVRNYLEIYRALLPGLKVCARATSS